MGTRDIRDYLDENDVVGEVVLLRAANENTIIVVEGSSDEKFLTHFIIVDEVDIVIAHGREKVLKAMPPIRARFPGVLCIIDADFDHLTGTDVSADDVIVTSEHDIEMMLVKSNAFNRVVGELGSKGKLAAVGQDQSPWTIIERPAHALGCLRLYSAQNDLNLKFERLRFRFLDKRTFQFAIKEMVQEVFQHSQKPNLDVPAAVGFISEWQSRQHDRHLMCCGHDFALLLGRALQSLIGSQTTVATETEQIERSLRLAFSVEDFRQTKLYDDIRAWEQRHEPYRCLVAKQNRTTVRWTSEGISEGSARLGNGVRQTLAVLTRLFDSAPGTILPLT